MNRDEKKARKGKLVRKHHRKRHKMNGGGRGCVGSGLVFYLTSSPRKFTKLALSTEVAVLLRADFEPDCQGML